MSSTTSPRPTPLSRDSTASIAARFSATNKTLRPLATSAAMRFAIVWLFPVPGGPWITRLRPDSTESMALRWDESASSTDRSCSGDSGPGGAPSSAPSSSWASGSPAIAATTSLSASRSPADCRSCTIGSFAYVNVPITCRSVISNPGTSASRAARVSNSQILPAPAAPRSAVTAPNTLASLCSSTGLTSTSSSRTRSKSSCLARVGAMVRPRSSTGAHGSRNNSSQRAMPIAR